MNSIYLKRFWWFLPISFVALLCMRIILNDHTFTDYAIFSFFGAIGIYLLIFKKDLFYSLCIFFIPLSINSSLLPGSNMSAPSELMILLLAAVAIILGISKPVYFKKILFHPIALLMLLDLAWMLVATLFSDMHFYSAKRSMARFLFLLVFYLLTAQWMVKKENMLKFFYLYSLGLIIPILVTSYHHSAYHFDPRTVFELSKPFYSDHTVFGACIAYVLPFALIFAVKARSFNFSKATVVFLWCLFFLLLIAEILTFSRAAWLSLVASLLMFIFLKLHLRFWHFMLVMVSLVILFFQFREPLYKMALENENISNNGEIKEHIMSVSNLNSDASNLERINRWLSAIRMYQDRPLTGFGPGTYQYAYGPYQSVYEMTHISTMAGDRGNAHSEPLTYLSETGFPGFISYLIWIIATIGFGIRAYHRSKDPFVKNMVLAALLGFITFFVHGLVNSFIDQVKMASLVFGSMAMIVVADLVSKSKPVSHETQEGH